MIILSKTEKETREFGQKLAAKLNGGEVVLLYGELGAGKTALVKGLAAGLGVKEKITSPTFALMRNYDIKTSKQKNPDVKSGSRSCVGTFVHIDTYRLKEAQELIDIGVEDYLGRAGVICAIEWPEKIEGLLKKKKTLKVKIERDSDGQRKIKLSTDSRNNSAGKSPAPRPFS